MSSARKRASRQKAANALEDARQRVMLAEHHYACLKTIAEEVARRHDAIAGLCRQLFIAEQAKNQQDWTATIKALEKIGEEFTGTVVTP